MLIFRAVGYDIYLPGKRVHIPTLGKNKEDHRLKHVGWVEICVSSRDENTSQLYPIGSMYGIFTYIYHKNQPKNVGVYTSPMDPTGIGIIS